MHHFYIVQQCFNQLGGLLLFRSFDCRRDCCAVELSLCEKDENETMRLDDRWMDANVIEVGDYDGCLSSFN